MAEDGVGQETRVERHRILHQAVGQVFTRLAAEFDAAIVSLPASSDQLRVERLVPADLQCAPITVAFDNFPGVSIRFGRWYTEFIPSCGCDYCDDDADQLAADLVEQIEAVARVGFTEEPDGSRVIGAFRQLGGDPRRWTRRTSDADRSEDDPLGSDLREPHSGTWSPWPRRQPTT